MCNKIHKGSIKLIETMAKSAMPVEKAVFQTNDKLLSAMLGAAAKAAGEKIGVEVVIPQSNIVYLNDVTISQVSSFWYQLEEAIYTESYKTLGLDQDDEDVELPEEYCGLAAKSLNVKVDGEKACCNISWLIGMTRQKVRFA